MINPFLFPFVCALCAHSSSPLPFYLPLSLTLSSLSSLSQYSLQNNIPVFCPALTDGSIGDMIYIHSYKNPGLIVDIAQGEAHVHVSELSVSSLRNVTSFVYWHFLVPLIIRYIFCEFLLPCVILWMFFLICSVLCMLLVTLKCSTYALCNVLFCHVMCVCVREGGNRLNDV